MDLSEAADEPILYLLQQVLGDDDAQRWLTGFSLGRSEVGKDVGDVRPVRQSLVDRDRPRGRRPDHRISADEFGHRALDDLERDIDLGRGDVLIFHLGLGQGGLLDRGPHHRLGAAIELAGLGELEQFARDHRLGRIIHREVGIVPLAHHAQPLELLALRGYPLGCISAAFGAELRDRHLVLVLLLGAIGLLDLPLDRQAVAIPAGNVRRVLAEQRLGADDDVLQHLVHRMAHMDIAIGVRRAIMEDEALAAGTGGAQPAVQIVGMPLGENRRFLGGKPRLHREIGLRQEDGIAPVARRSVGSVGHNRRAFSGGFRSDQTRLKNRRQRSVTAQARPSRAQSRCV